MADHRKAFGKQHNLTHIFKSLPPHNVYSYRVRTNLETRGIMRHLQYTKWDYSGNDNLEVSGYIQDI